VVSPRPEMSPPKAVRCRGVGGRGGLEAGHPKHDHPRPADDWCGEGCPGDGVRSPAQGREGVVGLDASFWLLVCQLSALAWLQGHSCAVASMTSRREAWISGELAQDPIARVIYHDHEKQAPAKIKSTRLWICEALIV